MISHHDGTMRGDGIRGRSHGILHRRERLWKRYNVESCEHDSHRRSRGETIGELSNGIGTTIHDNRNRGAAAWIRVDLLPFVGELHY